MIQSGSRPYDVPFDDTAIDGAKEFCKERNITPKSAKIVNKNGRVWVEAITNISMGSADNVAACRVCFHMKYRDKECKVCAKKRT